MGNKYDKSDIDEKKIEDFEQFKLGKEISRIMNENDDSLNKDSLNEDADNIEDDVEEESLEKTRQIPDIEDEIEEDSSEDIDDDRNPFDDDETESNVTKWLLLIGGGLIVLLIIIVSVLLFIRNSSSDNSEEADEAVIEASMDSGAGLSSDVSAIESSNSVVISDEEVSDSSDNEASDSASTDTSDASVAGSSTSTSVSNMKFNEADDTVTAKIETNIRDLPSQGDDSTVVYTLKNGETLHRIGISDAGWSKVEYNGQECYAVTSYLTTVDDSSAATTDSSAAATSTNITTTDTSSTSTTTASDATTSTGEVKTVFTDTNEQVTPKIEVNLRLLPSVTDAGATVVATVKNGEVLTRTGINVEQGWSRVEYNGQTLYCVSSYLQAVE